MNIEITKKYNKAKRDIVDYGSAEMVRKEFRLTPCSLPLSNPDFVLPTSEEVKKLRWLIGYSQKDLGRLGGKAVNEKGCSAVRKWETMKGKDDHRPMDYCLWRLMLYVAGVATIEDDIDGVNNYG